MFDFDRDTRPRFQAISAAVVIALVATGCSFETTAWQNRADAASPADTSDTPSRVRTDADEDTSVLPETDAGEEDVSVEDANEGLPDVSDRGEDDTSEDDLEVSDMESEEVVDPTQTAQCSVETMIGLYPGSLPPNPYGTWPRADACVASPHDVIIVLGCPTREDGSASDCQQRRIDIAMSLMRSGYSDRFIVSGAAVSNEHVEAEALRDLLLAEDVPTESIFLEPQAEHTDENIYYSSQLMVDHGWTSAIIVSDDKGHLMMTAVCDSNCCVRWGRLTLFEFPIDDPESFEVKVDAGHYALFPWAESIPAEECNKIERPLRAMCLNLDTRRACAGNVHLSD